jgi:hypothetical protein
LTFKRPCERSSRASVLDFADLAARSNSCSEHIPACLQTRQMTGLLSIRTAFPRQGGRVWYDDQHEAFRQTYAGDDLVEYALWALTPNSPPNRWRRQRDAAADHEFIFQAHRRAGYQPIIPTFIVGWHPERLRITVAFGDIVGAPGQAAAPSVRSAGMRFGEVKARLHQASGMACSLRTGKCTISRYPAAIARSNGFQFVPSGGVHPGAASELLRLGAASQIARPVRLAVQRRSVRVRRSPDWQLRAT